MSFGAAISTCFRKYATFDGRATRSEFWWFYLFVTLVAAIPAVPGYILMISGMHPEQIDLAPDQMLTTTFWVGMVLLMIGSIVQLAFVIPTLAVGSRRLHDRGQSGWLQLLLLVPCANFVLLVFWALAGTPGDNVYGPQPRT
jgi:uncharacterized membrane protein YhaH (DUF805 family)